MSLKVSFGNNVSQVSNQETQKTKKKLFTPLSKEDKKKARKNILIGYGIFILSTTAALFAAMVGRDPSKVAKVANGTNIVNEKAYNEAFNIIEELFSKVGDFETPLEKLKGFFVKPESITPLSEKIAQAEKYIQENNIPIDSEIVQKLTQLKQNLQLYINKANYNLEQGSQKFGFDEAKEFIETNKNLFSYVEDFFENNKEYDLSREFRWCSSRDLGINPYIRECPAEILPQDNIFYHGTLNGKKIYKNGFTPFVSRQLGKSPRELGAGIYTAPDIRVAASFSDLIGDIIPIKLQEDAKIALVDENSYSAFMADVGKFITERLGQETFEQLPKETQNAVIECAVRKMFLDMGYDAAYIPKGVRSGGGLLGIIFNPDINKVIGTNQKQVVIFSSEKTQIQPRGLKARLGDLKYKFDANKAKLNWAKDHPFGF